MIKESEIKESALPKEVKKSIIRLREELRRSNMRLVIVKSISKMSFLIISCPIFKNKYIEPRLTKAPIIISTNKMREI